VDAPLDDQNVGRYVRMLNEFKERTQFIVITHNPRTTTEAADAVYGVTMQEPGVSSLVSVRLRNRNGETVNGGIDTQRTGNELTVPADAASEQVKAAESGESSESIEYIAESDQVESFEPMESVAQGESGEPVEGVDTVETVDDVDVIEAVA